MFSEHRRVKLEIINGITFRKVPNIWKLNNMLQNNSWFKGDIKKKIKIYYKWNKNEDTTYQNFQGTTEAIARGKFIALNAYVRKKERSQISDISFHIKKLEKD